MQFADTDIGLFWDDSRLHLPRKVPPDVRKALYRKLLMLDAASDLRDLRIPPGNKLEALKGVPCGKHSIRVNDQWRLCFKWENGEATEVEFLDYH